MKKWGVLVTAFLGCMPLLAHGQGAVQQSGAVTNNSTVMWARDHFVRKGAGEAGGIAGEIATGGSSVVGKVCSWTNPTNQSGIELCLDSVNAQLVYNGTGYPISGGGGNVVGANSTTIDQLACWNSTTGTLLKDCGTITSRTTWSNTLSGDIVGTLQGGVQITTNTNNAQNISNVGKINALYAHNVFGGNALEGQRAAVFGHITQNGTSPVTGPGASVHYSTAVWAWNQVIQGNTVAGQEENYHGYGGLMEVGGTTRAFNLHGIEQDCNIANTATVGNRVCILAAIGAGTMDATKRATDADMAYAVGRATTADATFKTFYSLRSPNGAWPGADDTILIGGLGANNNAPDAGNALAGTGIDFTGITFTFQQYISDTFQIDADGRTFIFTELPHMQMRDTNVAVTAGGLVRWASVGTGNWVWQVNTAAGGDFSTAFDSIVMLPTGVVGHLASAVSGTITPVNAAGLMGYAGVITTPAVGANGSGYQYLTVAGGVNLIGKGSTSDFTIRNSAGTAVWTLPTGGTAPALPVVTTGVPVASLCIDATGNIIKKTTAGSCV